MLLVFLKKGRENMPEYAFKENNNIILQSVKSTFGCFLDYRFIHS